MAEQIFQFETTNYEFLVLNLNEEPIQVTRYEMNVMQKFKDMNYDVFLGKAGDIPGLCRDELDFNETVQILELDEEAYDNDLLIIGCRRK